MRRWRSWTAFASPSTSPRRALVIEVVLLLAGLWLAGHVIYLTVYGPHVTNQDIKEYFSYALNFWTVHPLLRHLPVEYPPLAIFPFTLTLLPPLADHDDVFAFWMSGVIVLSYLWIRRRFSREQAIAFAVLLLVGANSTVLARFDLFPALATLGALWALLTRRFTWAYVLLAIGILLKLYPVFLVPVAAIEHWRALHVPSQTKARARRRAPRPTDRLRQAWRALRAELGTPAVQQPALGVLLCGVLVGAAFGIAALRSPTGAFSGFTYANARPLQIESLPATLLWLGTLVGLPAHAEYTFNSLNFVGPLDTILKPLSTIALVLGCLFVYWRQLRGYLDVGQAMIACLCVVLVANKVFSPQYLIWVFPLVAIVYGLDWYWLVLGLLTTIIYPYLYYEHGQILDVAVDWRFWPVVALRNALLVVVTVRAILGVRGSPAIGPAPAPLAAAASKWSATRSRDRPARQVSAGIS